MDLITQFLNDPTFWVMVAFFVFVGALARPISGAITAALDKRADKIRADLEEAERLTQQGRKRLKAALERREKQAMDRIAQAEAAALEQVQAHTVDVAIGATRDFLADNLKGKQAEALIETAIKELPKKLH